jgi:hypothetical protein
MKEDGRYRPEDELAIGCELHHALGWEYHDHVAARCQEPARTPENEQDSDSGPPSTP